MMKRNTKAIVFFASMLLTAATLFSIAGKRQNSTSAKQSKKMEQLQTTQENKLSSEWQTIA